jgi:hypothetical protein
MSQQGSVNDGGTILPDIETLTGNAGGAVGPDAAFNVDILGASGITVTGNPGANTLTIAPTGGVSIVGTLTGDAGGAVGPDGSADIDLLGGTGCVTTGTPGSNQIVFDVTGGGITWSREAGAAVAAAVDSGYINTNVGLTTVTLPATAALGTVIEIMGESAAGWTIAQNAGQSIQFGNLSTTVGVGGSLASTNRWDTVKIVCRVADTTWSVTSNVGVLNVV